MTLNRWNLACGCGGGLAPPLVEDDADPVGPCSICVKDLGILVWNSNAITDDDFTLTLGNRSSGGEIFLGSMSFLVSDPLMNGAGQPGCQSASQIGDAYWFTTGPDLPAGIDQDQMRLQRFDLPALCDLPGLTQGGFSPTAQCPQLYIRLDKIKDNKCGNGGFTGALFFDCDGRPYPYAWGLGEGEYDIVHPLFRECFCAPCDAPDWSQMPEPERWTGTQWGSYVGGGRWKPKYWAWGPDPTPNPFAAATTAKICDAQYWRRTIEDDGTWHGYYHLVKLCSQQPGGLSEY